MSQNKHKDSSVDDIKSATAISGADGGSEFVTIDLQPYAIPIAIIINALIIALAIFLAGRNTNTNTATGTTPTTTVTATTAAVANSTETTTAIANSPYLGNKETAKIAIVEYSDVECPYCQRHHLNVFPSIISEYVNSGKAIYVFRNYIAVSAHKPASTTEAYAALCVKEISGSNTTYFDMLNLLFTNTQTNGKGLPDGTTVYSLATTLGIDSSKLKTCIDSAKYADTMTADETAGTAAGVSGTPGFVVGVLKSDGTVNGIMIAGAYDITEFERVANIMLTRAAE